MPFSKQPIFRERAIKRYLQRQEQGIVLRVVSPPVFAFYWMILLFLLGAGGFAWAAQTPISVGGQGIIVEQAAAGQSGHEVVAVLFFSPDRRADLHVGQPATVNIGPTAVNVTGSVEHVEAELISPSEIHRRFTLPETLAQAITAPSLLVTIQLGSVASTEAYDGSVCSAQVHIGSRSVLSLLPGFNQILGK